MVTCAERRFGISNAPRPVKWLSDNASAYIAKDTLDTATALGLKLCFTPIRSPESNWPCGCLREDIQTELCRSRRTPRHLALLPAWFEDYNEVHPHSGLKFLSPRQFLRRSA